MISLIVGLVALDILINVGFAIGRVYGEYKTRKRRQTFDDDLKSVLAVSTPPPVLPPSGSYTINRIEITESEQFSQSAVYYAVGSEMKILKIAEDISTHYAIKAMGYGKAVQLVVDGDKYKLVSFY